MNPGLFEIFSTKRKSRINKPKKRIIIDNRERNSLIPSELSKFFEIDFQQLKVADYIINGIAIERKTINDFISSMINHRLLNQLEELQQYKNRLLLIEGFEEQELYDDTNPKGVPPNALRGFILSILLKHQIPIIFTKNYKDTVKYIQILANKKTQELPLNVKKKSFNKKEQLQFILESFPGIGPKTARKLLKEYKTLNQIFHATQENLKESIGKKAEIFKLLKENYKN